MFNFFKKLLGVSSAPQETVTEILTPPAPVADAPVAEAKPQRAKDAKGKFVADDPSTPDVNEAWKGGKAPAKKVKAISAPIPAKTKPAVKEGTTKGGNGAVKQRHKQSNKPKAPPKPKAKK